MILEKETSLFKPDAIANSLNNKASGAEAIKREHAIYFRTNEPKVFADRDYPTTWVTQSEDVYDQWTLKIPPIAESTDSGITKYLYLYTCVQMQKVNGDLDHTEALLDDSTTIIDGGTVITGSVTANKLDAHDINASATLSVGAFTQTAQEAILNSELADDIAAKSDKSASVTSTVSVYYRSTSQSNPGINRDITIGTSATTDNAWEYVMPQPKRGCYFYTCEKYTYVNGSVGFSTVRELTGETYASKYVSANDNTFIDGGRIYAHSVTADQLNASAISVGSFFDDGSYATPGDVADVQEAAEQDAAAKANAAKNAAINAASEDAAARASAAESNAKTAAREYASAAESNAKTAAQGYASDAESNAKTAAREYAQETITVKDTRNDNQTPAWYIQNYPKKSVVEFKLGTAIGITNSDTYCYMRTDVPWGDRLGGYPKQTVEMGGKQYWRQGASDTAWSSWVDAYGTAVAASAANNYVTRIDGYSGINVHDANDLFNFANVSSDGMKVYKSGDNVAQFGETSRVGKANSHNCVFSSQDVTFKKGNITSGSIAAQYWPNATPDRGLFLTTTGTMRFDAGQGVTVGGSGNFEILNNVLAQSDITVAGTLKAAQLIATSPSTGTSSTANCRLLSASSYGKYEVGFTASSSKRYKHDINQVDDGALNPERLYDLEVKQFVYNDDYINENDQRRNKNVIGFIAEDVEKIYPIAADYRDGKIETWDERYIIPPMLSLIQKQHYEIMTLKKEIEELKIIVDRL